MMTGYRRLIHTSIFASLLTLVLASPAGAQRRQCVDCHEDFKDRLKKDIVHDPVKESCESCHKRHGFAQKLVLTKGMPELCIDCHPDVQSEIEGSNVHEALSEGGCTVCHDPHSSNSKGLLREVEGTTSVCFYCHQDLQAIVEDPNAHEPFAKGACATCHEPHSSDRPALLTAAESDICERCHQGAAAKHKMPGLDDFSCSDCHDPHLASKKSRLAAAGHDPFVSGDCSDCHDVEDQEVEFSDDFPRPDLCADCHDDVTELVTGPESHFDGNELKDGGTSTCLDCHDPHKSAENALLTGPEASLCRTCHEDLVNPQGFMGPVHPPFRDGQCSRCHEPHGGGGSSHLTAEGDDLCRSCHEAFGPGPDGTVSHEAMELSGCIDCHTGHASEYPGLLVEDVGSTCLRCHEKDQHTVGHPPYLTSTCEACHANHSTFDHLLAGPVQGICLNCHRQQAIALASNYPHPAATDDDCLSCHVAHGGENVGLLNEPQGELCMNCHDMDDLVVHAEAGEGEEGELEIHTAVAEGNCAGCHDPHGSMIEGMLNRDRDQLCYGCHQNEKVAFEVGDVHEPVAEGRCERCHTTHGSVFGSLTVMSEPELCTQCHDSTERPLADIHKGFDVSQSRCTACHNPHNSTANDLLNPVLHAPFEAGDCEDCHAPPQEGSPATYAAVSADVCMDCHDDLEEMSGHHKVSDIECTDCHEPHSSRFESLLHNPARLCKSCHADVLEVAGGGKGAYVHRPIESGSCLDCHQMHEPSAAPFLETAQKNLCSNCHEPMAERKNDPGQHEPFKQGKCSECHSTHVSTERYLLVTAAAELCMTCHDIQTATMAQAHHDMPLTGRGCTTCHDPHSSKRAGRSLLYPTAHSPYEDNDCDVCHDSDGKPTERFITCVDCHDYDANFSRAHNGGRVGDEAGSVGVCIDCHSPHVGGESLLRRPSERETCLRCHERAEFTREIVHEALDDGCTTCHDVHANNIGDLRGLAVADICSDCHEDAEKTHAHPLGADYTDPRTSGPITCMSCHEPHSADHEKLLSFDQGRDLCVQCHSSGTLKVR